MTKKESIFILFSITLCWSSTYIFIKDIPQEFSVYAYLALTSGVAGILLTLVMRKKLALLNRVSLRQGLILGALITASNMFEKLGLDQIPASSASVYASMGIIIVPLIMILKKEYPSRNNMLGILIILIGIFTSNWGNADGAGLLGGLYILGSAASMSVYTVLATEYTKETDPSLLTVLQMLVTALFGFILWMATDAGSLFTIEWSKMTLSYIFLIAFFSKCYAYLMLMHADKYADPVSVTIVASTEPVVTLLAAVLLPEALGGVERFSARAVAGAMIISLGAIVAGTNFLSKKRRVDAEQTAADNAAAHIPEVKNASPENSDKTAAASLPRMPSPLSIFAIVTVMFTILSVSINVMQFAGGLSQIRPVNAIPAPVGLVFGPVGAVACALGNLLGDLPNLDLYGGTIALGVVGNFMLAFIPYKVWRAMDGDSVSVHRWRQIGLFVWSAALSCMFCALLLGFGLETVFGQYYPELISVTFFNNLVFTIAFGLPVLIVLTSTDFGLGIWVTRMLRIPDNFRMPGLIPNRFAAAVCFIDTVVLGAAFVLARQGMSLGSNPLMKVLAVLTVACAVATCLIGGKEARG